ncbi:MAG: phasin family protein [Blastocatellia bacterium]|nr:phasin family protein [Blastocatellia bacterium]
MPKTTRTTKTTKTATGTKARHSTRAAEKPVVKTQTPIELVRDVATKGIHLGLGLGSYIFEGPQGLKHFTFSGNIRNDFNSIVNNAIGKGEKIEREQVSKLVDFEREQVGRIKSFISARKKDLKRTELTLEEKIESVIASLDIPTRHDIQELNRKLNALSKELARQRKEEEAPKTSKRAKKTDLIEEESMEATA